MSFADSLNTSNDKVVISFIEKLSSHFSISKDEILALWRGGGIKTTATEIPKELLCLSKNELVEMCKTKSLKHGGSKSDLIQRILSSENQQKIIPLITVAAAATAKAPPPQPKLVSKAPSIALHRNTFGNFEHEETHFVFNEKTQKVVGKQNPDGTLLPLTVDDINICHKFKFEYQIPVNLQDQDEKIELAELDEEEIEVEVIEEEDDGEEQEDESEVELELEDDE